MLRSYDWPGIAQSRIPRYIPIFLKMNSGMWQTMSITYRHIQSE